MTKETKYTLFPLIALILLAFGAVLFAVREQNNQAIGAATPGLAASVATTSAFALSAGTAATIMGTTTCSGGTVVISTQAAALFTFDDRYSPTGTFGFSQAASTTVAYDSGLYGCGKVKGISATAQSLTVSVTQ